MGKSIARRRNDLDLIKLGAQRPIGYFLSSAQSGQVNSSTQLLWRFPETKRENLQIGLGYDTILFVIKLKCRLKAIIVM